MEELIKSKENFVNTVGQILLENGFSKEDNIYTKTNTHFQPGSTMQVNGQVFQEPPKEIKQVITIKEIGDGYVESEDGSKRDFTEYSIQSVNNGLLSGVCVAMYWDEPEEIKKWVK